MSTITRERLEQLANFRGAPVTRQEEQELARIALASLEAELVAWTDEDELRDAKNGGSGYMFAIGGDANKFADPRRQVMLYTAPPAPVIQETADREILKRLAVILSGSDAPGEIRSLTVTARSFVDRCKTLATERDDCRAAMLQGTDGNSPVIPDGWVVVPEEPTHEMLEAGDEQFGTYDVYRRMIAAAPQQEVK